jgi:hypothetical protein
MALVIGSAMLACDAKWLAWTGTCPQRPVIGPSCEPCREAPATDASEEVDLSIAHKVS